MKAINDLLEIMAKLRDPDTGCPWDRAQDYASIAPYTIEEAYEVVDAIERKDHHALKDELGDLLFQVVFYAQLAKEEKLFDFAAVAEAICSKMIRRHPHVFDTAEYADEAQLHQAWEQIKASERQAKISLEQPSALDDIPIVLPALSRAIKLQKRAARVGFDWATMTPVLAKVREELDELTAAIEEGENSAVVAEEYGDLLFACANLARFLHLDPEPSLRAACQKFEQRFRQMEGIAVQEGKEFKNLTLDEQENLWQKVKSSEAKMSKK